MSKTIMEALRALNTKPEKTKLKEASAYDKLKALLGKAPVETETSVETEALVDEDFKADREAQKILSANSSKLDSCKTAKQMLNKAIEIIEANKDKMNPLNFNKVMTRLNNMKNKPDTAIFSALGTYLTGEKVWTPESLEEAKGQYKFVPISTADEYYPDPVKREDLNEAVEDSMPVTILPENQVVDFVMAIEPATQTRPLRTFKLGYIKEMSKEIASKFRGGRGSIDKETGEHYSFVRIFKAVEYSNVETATNPRTTRAGKEADRLLGTERHTGERTGFEYTGDEYAFRIGQYQDGSKALQACINKNSRQKVKYFISLDGSDLQEIDRSQVGQYLTPAEANKLNAPTVRKAAGQDAQGNDVFDKPINRFKLTGIYMIGDLGSSIM